MRTEHVTYESIYEVYMANQISEKEKVILLFAFVYVFKQLNYLSPAATLIRHVYNGVYIFFYCSFMTLSYHLHLINKTWMKCVFAWII